MALFEGLAEIDIITPILDRLSSGAYIYDTDEKLKIGKKSQLKTETPWIDTKIADDRLCGRWHVIYFREYGIISRNCFHCWKIVVRPRTLENLFKLYELQQKMDLPSKCGAETRAYATHKGWYAGFWYCPMEGGLEGAREHCRMVSLKVKEALGVQTQVTLKRACTEFENTFGPSNLWEYPEGWGRLEDLLDSTWEIPVEYGNPMPSPSKVAITRRWIDWGREHGDKTADQYYEGSETFGVVDTITYHDTKIEPKVNPPMTFKPWEEEDGESAEIQRLPED